MSKALVLSGGGPVGIAWESGLLAGLAENGVDVSSADYIVGTSAGAFVGAQIAQGTSLAEIAAPDLAGQVRGLSVASRMPDLTVLLSKMMEMVSGKRPAEEVRAEIGEWALSVPTMREEEFLERFAPSLGYEFDGKWPAKGFACTAVDAADGSFVVWNQDSGIGLARAVASSCAVPGIYPPVTFRGHRYIDGGMRSGTNADLAAGHDVVLVIAVAAASRAMPEAFRRRFDAEIQTLRDGGGRVEVVTPSEECSAAMGVNLMDPTQRQAAAITGRNQGLAEAARLMTFWS